MTLDFRRYDLSQTSVLFTAASIDKWSL